MKYLRFAAPSVLGVSYRDETGILRTNNVDVNYITTKFIDEINYQFLTFPSNEYIADIYKVVINEAIQKFRCHKDDLYLLWYIPDIYTGANELFYAIVHKNDVIKS